jgi:LPS sulfotransferase NodH
MRRVRRVRRRRSTTTLPSISDATVVFIIASPRSGTTWLQRALNEHPEITCGENRLFGSYFDVVQEGQRRRPRITVDEFAMSLAQRTVKQDLAASVDHYANDLTAAFADIMFSRWRHYSGKSILVDKVTPYPGTACDVVQKIRTFFPQARVIQLVRDGRDVMTSGVFHWMQKSIEGARPVTGDQRRRAVFVDGQVQQPLSRFFTDHDIDLWGQSWLEPIEAVRKHGPENVLQIRYEDMITDQFEVLRQICVHVGAQPSSSVLRTCVKHSSFERMSGGRRAGEADPKAHVRKGVAGDWRNYFTRHDGELFERICGQQLLRLGYTENSGWSRELSDMLQIRKAS